MPRSMTGYGAAEGPIGEGRLAIEIRTVNHRHFSAQLRLPGDLQALENDLRARVRQRLERGHVTLSARWAQAPERPLGIQLNLERARAVHEALRALKEALGIAGEIDLGFIARQPDVFTSTSGEDPDVPSEQVSALLDQALDEVVTARTREGEALALDLRARLDAIAGGVAAIEARAPERLVAERDRLHAAVSELLHGRTLDEARLSQEIALLAEKLDITEEIVRLRAHLEAFEHALQVEGPLGRHLSFLGQEILREINTIGSKANDAPIAHTVIAMKGELEKIREQVENIE